MPIALPTQEELKIASGKVVAYQQQKFGQQVHDTLSQSLAGAGLMTGLLSKSLPPAAATYRDLLVQFTDQLKKCSEEVQHFTSLSREQL